jgi:hypothetical protein
MDSKFNAAVAESAELFAEFRLSEALMATYKLVWDDFCSVYLELAKPAYGAPIDAVTSAATERIFAGLLKLFGRRDETDQGRADHGKGRGHDRRIEQGPEHQGQRLPPHHPEALEHRICR